MKFRKYVFSDHTGYIVAPWLPNVLHDAAAIRHSAFVDPWRDEDVHFHENSEEFYFLRHGKLWLLINDFLVDLEPHEFLQVKAKVPHAVVKGEGKIEHLLIRTPAINDRQTVQKVPEKLPQAARAQERELRQAWGCRVSVNVAANQNCWLFGFGQASFPSSQLCLAYIDHPTQNDADAYKHTYRHCLHLHQNSWEYYTVLSGAKTLQVADAYVTVRAGEILEVPPNVKHMFHQLEAPFAGFTFRTPLAEDKVEFL